MSRSSHFDDERGGGHRLLRVGENIRHALAGILSREDLQDPDLEGVSITVTEVRCSPDLRNATVYIMPLGGNGEQEVADALNRCSRFLRGQLSRQVRMKYLPRLKFIVDASFGEADHIERLLHSPKVAQDLERRDDRDEEDR
ncbi:30S ribosome-binding factor RbfA [Luteithermobacter gelatinilyticus]|uniref:30S ribosome-binding factor RbfA n=1 Tax=Luteithermobacter gelatinilyticus TaxID=2582913 RepID=UPI001106D404|nr:30S ribosome-binding factor RbfA [Luteithermobacter gelatinilyticus]